MAKMLSAPISRFEDIDILKPLHVCSALSTLPCLLSCFHNERIKWNAIPGGGELPSKVTALATLAEEDGPCKPWEPRIQSVFGWYLQQLQVSLVHLSNDQQICAQRCRKVWKATCGRFPETEQSYSARS